MRKQSDYKFLITICCIYEIITFLTLYTHNVCDLWLKPCGLQYIILCLIIPVIAILLWIWKADIFKKCKPYVVPTVITSVLFVPLIVYFLAKPTVFDFTNTDILNNKISSVEQKCLKQEKKKRNFEDYEDVSRKCSWIGWSVRLEVENKKVAKEDFWQIAQDKLIMYREFPNYATKPCEKIISEEMAHCYNDKKCFCVSGMIALAIKKDPNLQYSNERINLRLKSIRQQAEAYCAKQDMNKWLLTGKQFCKDNDI